jgi:hypothetical protein
MSWWGEDRITGDQNVRDWIWWSVRSQADYCRGRWSYTLWSNFESPLTCFDVVNLIGINIKSRYPKRLWWVRKKPYIRKWVYPEIEKKRGGVRMKHVYLPIERTRCSASFLLTLIILLDLVLKVTSSRAERDFDRFMSITWILRKKAEPEIMIFLMAWLKAAKVLMQGMNTKKWTFKAVYAKIGKLVRLASQIQDVAVETMESKKACKR